MKSYLLILNIYIQNFCKVFLGVKICFKIGIIV